MIKHSLQIFIGQLNKLLNHLHILENLESVSEEIQASNLVDRVSSSLFLKTSWKHPC